MNTKNKVGARLLSQGTPAFQKFALIRQKIKKIFYGEHKSIIK